MVRRAKNHVAPQITSRPMPVENRPKLVAMIVGSADVHAAARRHGDHDGAAADGGVAARRSGAAQRRRHRLYPQPRRVRPGQRLGWPTGSAAARVFRAAIALFTLGSIAVRPRPEPADELTAARVLQGLGGAMMVPVGRLVLFRVVEKSQLIGAWPICRCRRSSARCSARRSAASSPPISPGAGSSWSMCRSAFWASCWSRCFSTIREDTRRVRSTGSAFC